MPAGSDSFNSIGLPQGQHSSSRSWDAASIAAGQQQWLDAVEQVFPSSRAGHKQQQQQQRGGGVQGGGTVAFTPTYLEEGESECWPGHAL